MSLLPKLNKEVSVVPSFRINTNDVTQQMVDRSTCKDEMSCLM